MNKLPYTCLNKRNFTENEQKTHWWNERSYEIKTKRKNINKSKLKPNSVLRATDKYEIPLDDKQNDMLKEWIHICIDIYNITNDYIKLNDLYVKRLKNGKKLYNKLKYIKIRTLILGRKKTKKKKVDKTKNEEKKIEDKQKEDNQIEEKRVEEKNGEIKGYLDEKYPHIRERCKKSQVPIIMIRSAIKDLVRNYNSSIGAVINGSRYRFAIRNYSHGVKKFGFELDRTNITCENGLLKLFPNSINIEVKDEFFDELDHDPRLIYDFSGKRLNFCKVVDVKIDPIVPTNKACGIDLGIRTYATIYSIDKVIDFANETVTNPIRERIKEADMKKEEFYEKYGKSDAKKAYANYKKRLDKVIDKPDLNEREFCESRTKTKNIAKAYKKYKKNIVNKPVLTEDQFIKQYGRTKNIAKAYKNRRKRLKKKIKNQIADMQNHLAVKLCHEYKTIYLGDIKTKSLLMSRRTSKKVKGDSGYFSHYKFKLKLKNVAEKYGTKLVLVNEAYTSQKCGNCRYDESMGPSKTYKCNQLGCGYHSDRDHNAARNMFIKGKSL